ncbi:hypothetical protein DWB98_13465 (plasmid) [Staphylococcus xylosus]|uniref:hypothetical protein n=1 Tax=Staphylococcus TaxID=1279 RepID=UPI00118BC7F5|nr:hypothetical protein [Staphylococcus xylosus]MBM6639458.1 hypothetical protein [Staphylococcus xylosus]QDW90451.1 hypothetical protein DWB98_13465 [Staphylococcus xylosus]
MFENLYRKIKRAQLRYYIKFIVRPSKRKYAHLKKVSVKEYKSTVKKEIMRVVFMHYLIPITIILVLSVNAIIYWIRVGFGI